MSTQPKTFLTPEQYLEIERKAEYKSEYYRGEMFAMAGASYLGIVQWAIAARVGPELKAMALLVTSTDPFDLVYAGGAFSLETGLVWMSVLAGQERRLAFLRQGLVGRKLKPLFSKVCLLSGGRGRLDAVKSSPRSGLLC